MPEFEIRARCSQFVDCEINMDWMRANQYTEVRRIENCEELNAEDDADHLGIIRADSIQEAIQIATKMQTQLKPKINRLYVKPLR